MTNSVDKALLHNFFTQRECYVVGNTPATTRMSCGAVFLAAIVDPKASMQTLSEDTGLPEVFVSAALSMLHESEWLYSLNSAHLVFAVRDTPTDHSQIAVHLDQLTSKFWRSVDHGNLGRLMMLRSGYVYGGQRQSWTDEEFLPSNLISAD